MRRCRLTFAVGVVAVALGACGLTDDRFGSSTLPPIGPVTGGTLAAPGASIDPGAAPLIDTGPRSPKIVGEGCALTAPGATGAPASVTYSFATSLFELSADAETARCLMALPQDKVDQRPLWAPTGDRFLISPGVVMIDAKLGASGLQADATRAIWSAPDASLLVAVTDDGRLVRRPVDGSGKLANISFMKNTSAVVYHPGGAVLFAAGTARDGTAQIVLSEPAGKLFRPVVLLPAGAQVPEVAAAADGQSISFIEVSAVTSRVRALHLPELTLTTRIETSTPLSGLVHDGDVVAVRAGECSGSTSTRLSTGAATLDLNAAEPFVGRSTEPVGFVSGSLIVASRQTGCSGPADVWAVDPADVSVPTLLISGVTEVSVRPAPLPPVDLPADLKQEPAQG